MVADIAIAVVCVSLGGVLALFVEAQKKLYHIYMAIALLVGAGLLGLAEKVVARIADG